MATHEDKVLEAGHTDKIVEATVKVSEVPTADASITPVTDTEKQEEKPNDSTARKLMTDSWLWEALGLGQFVLCIVAIVGILLAYDGKPLTIWNSRANLSINTIISILQQVAMMGLTIPLINCMHQAKWLWFAGEERPLSEFLEMDNAKGTVGSIRLLLKPGRRWLVSLGAVVTLLTLVWRPFTQQAVNYPQVPFTTNSTDNGTSIAYTLALEDPSRLDGSYSMDEHLKMRIQQGVWSSSRYDANNIASCASSSCIYNDYKSLGIYANSSDISNQTITSCSDYSCTFSVPGGPSILSPNTYFQTSHQIPGYCQNTIQLNITTDVLPPYSGDAPSWRYSVWPNLIIHFQALLVMLDSNCQRNVTAFDGDIYWSANTYNVQSYGNGTLYLQTNAYDVDNWQVTSIENAGTNFSGITYETDIGTILVTDYQTLQISEYFATIFNGSGVSFLNNNAKPVDNESPAAVLNFLYEMSGTSVAADNFTAFTVEEDALNVGVLDSFVDFVNGGLLDIGNPDFIVAGALPPSTQAGKLYGSFVTSQTIVHVVWAWMTLPFLLTALVLILLLGTMHQTKKMKLQLWRSSTVPVLRAGSGANSKDGVVLGTNRELEDETRNVSIALKRDDAGQWRVFTKDLATVANKTMMRRNAARTVYIKSVQKQVDGLKKKAVNEAVDKVEDFAEKVFDNLFSSR